MECSWFLRWLRHSMAIEISKKCLNLAYLKWHPPDPNLTAAGSPSYSCSVITTACPCKLLNNTCFVFLSYSPSSYSAMFKLFDEWISLEIIWELLPPKSTVRVALTTHLDSVVILEANSSKSRSSVFGPFWALSPYPDEGYPPTIMTGDVSRGQPCLVSVSLCIQISSFWKGVSHFQLGHTFLYPLITHCLLKIPSPGMVTFWDVRTSTYEQRGYNSVV